MPTFDVNGLPMTLEDHRVGVAWERTVSGFLTHSASTPDHLCDARRRDHERHEAAALAGLPEARGLAAFRTGTYDMAFEQLRRALPLLQRIGGSQAQRDVFTRLATEAGIRAGRWREAIARLQLAGLAAE